MRGVLAVGAVLLSACASGSFPARTHHAPALFRTATVDTPASAFIALLPPVAEAEPAALPAAPGARDGVSLEVRFETAGGETILAPRITAFHGQRANVEVFAQTSYIADFDVEKKDGAFIVDPVIQIVQDGIALEMTARPGARGTALAYAVRIARLRRPIDVESFTDLQGNRLTLQLPTLDRAAAEGVRGMEDGVWGLLARLPDGKGGTVSVLARVVPEKLEFSSKEEDARDLALIDPAAGPPRASPFPAGGEDSLPSRAARVPLPERPAGRLDLRTVSFSSDLPPGSVAEAGAASAVLGTATPVEPGDLQVVTGLIPGATASCTLDESYVKEYEVAMGTAGPEDPETGVHTSGLTAEVAEDGSLGITWTTTPRWDRFTTKVWEGGRSVSVEVPWSETHRARVVPGPGTRLVVLARLPGGRALGVLVRFTAE